MKTCATCQQVKPLSEFYKWRQAEDGHRPHCKACYNAKAREYWKNDPKRPERLLTRRKYHLRQKYGLTPEQYQHMLDSQGGQCVICSRTAEEAGGRHGSLPATLHVDHDHACCPGSVTCGKCVRGLLCVRCNRMIYWIEQMGLAKVAAYLRLGGTNELGHPACMDLAYTGGAAAGVGGVAQQDSVDSVRAGRRPCRPVGRRDSRVQPRRQRLVPWLTGCGRAPSGAASPSCSTVTATARLLSGSRSPVITSG